MSKAWAKALLVRMNFVRRKGKVLKSARHLPTDFVNIKQAFLGRIATLIEEHKIPRELLINSDQIGSKFMPVSEWTMEERGSKQVPLTGLDVKRENTVLLGISVVGMLLPPQLAKRKNVIQVLCFPEDKMPGAQSPTGALPRLCIDMLKIFVYRV